MAGNETSQSAPPIKLGLGRWDRAEIIHNVESALRVFGRSERLLNSAEIRARSLLFALARELEQQERSLLR